MTLDEELVAEYAKPAERYWRDRIKVAAICIAFVAAAAAISPPCELLLDDGEDMYAMTWKGEHFLWIGVPQAGTYLDSGEYVVERRIDWPFAIVAVVVATAVAGVVLLVVGPEENRPGVARIFARE